MYKIITALALFLLSTASLATHCPGVADFVKLEIAQNPHWTLKKNARIDWRIVQQPQSSESASHAFIPVTSGLTVKLTSDKGAKCIYRLPNMKTVVVRSKEKACVNILSLNLRSYKVAQKSSPSQPLITVYTCHTSAQHPELCRWNE